MKILIVEDNLDSRVLLRKMLEGTGHEVSEAVHGQDALARAKETTPELIISDILMPVMDGFKLCYEVKHDEKLRSVPFIFYTATYVDLEDERLAMGLGASRYIIKPMDPQEFLKVIEDVVAEAAGNELSVPEELVEDPLNLFRKYDTSVSRKLEKKVRELDLYQKVFANALDGVLITDNDGKILEQNPALTALFGYDHADLAGRSAALILGEEVFRNVMAEALRGEPFKRTCEAARQDGTQLIVDISVTALRNERGRKTALVWTIMDITRRCAAEAGQQLFRRLVDASNDAIFVIDAPTSCLLDVNARACVRLGYDREQLLALRLIDIDANLTDMDMWERHLAELADQAGMIVESQHRGRDGSVFPVEVSIVRTSEAGRDLIMAVARDITERRQAEARERQAKQEWDKTFDAVQDIITLQDSDMRLIRVNRAAHEAFRAGVGDLLGKFCYQVFRGTAEPCQGCPVPDTLENFVSYSAEIEHPNLNKIFWVTASPILDENGGISSIAHFARDITKQKRMEIQIRQSQKMEAIGTLAGGIAHDFNNILTAILGYAELALGEVEKDSDAAVDIREIAQAGRRAGELVRQILTFSRQTEHEKKPVRIQYIVKEALQLLRASIPTRIALRQDIDAAGGTVLADPTQIHQVVMNLSTNAYHAMRESGGVLGVTLKAVQIGPAKDDRLLGLLPGPYLDLTVSDTGCGMDKATMEKIFEPYFTTKKKGEGTGLGLAVAHGIVTQHGGRITVYSEPGRGSTFHVYLPELATMAPELNNEEFEVAPRGTERVLVVDDESIIVILEQRILTDLGYRVTALTSSVAAQQLFAAKPAEFDLVITDMAMPEMTGMELAASLLAVRPDIPIILCTGFSEIINEDTAKALGIREYVMKPVLRGKLATVVRKVLDEK